MVMHSRRHTLVAMSPVHVKAKPKQANEHNMALEMQRVHRWMNSRMARVTREVASNSWAGHDGHKKPYRMESVKTERLPPVLTPAQGQQKACHFLYHLESDMTRRCGNMSRSAQRE